MAAEKLEQGTIYSRSGFWLLGSHPFQHSHGWGQTGSARSVRARMGCFPEAKPKAFEAVKNV
jgi:hypothetical protein